MLLQLPDGATHWPLVAPGNPKAEEAGSVRCRLCMHFESPSQFTREEGYTGGKRQGLVQHQVGGGGWVVASGLVGGGGWLEVGWRLVQHQVGGGRRMKVAVRG